MDLYLLTGNVRGNVRTFTVVRAGTSLGDMHVGKIARHYLSPVSGLLGTIDSHLSDPPGGLPPILKLLLGRAPVKS